VTVTALELVPESAIAARSWFKDANLEVFIGSTRADPRGDARSFTGATASASTS
jgi:hypothetical protein